MNIAIPLNVVFGADGYRINAFIHLSIYRYVCPWSVTHHIREAGSHELV